MTLEAFSIFLKVYFKLNFFFIWLITKIIAIPATKIIPAASKKYHVPVTKYAIKNANAATKLAPDDIIVPVAIFDDFFLDLAIEEVIMISVN
ncbi:MAG TPA: hypothetical protein VEC36_00100 [Patescibacteria group bacterium]|nr:hypothetical protein [Patescibacteria group bacterium]